MQHLDEGTIHGWIDGALSAEEAARADAHVTECAGCAAKVAEARGFIAASSRILTALDDAPRGVIPAGVPKRPRIWASRPYLQAAAAALVVVTGGMLVLRVSRDGPSRVASVSGKSTTARAAPVIAPPTPSVIPADSAAHTPVRTVVSAARIPASPRAARVTEQAAAPTTPPSVVVMAPVKSTDNVARNSDTTIDIVRKRDVLQSESQVVTGVVTTAATSTNLKVVKTERVPGGTRTTYEVAPGQTVLLTETETITSDSRGARSSAAMAPGTPSSSPNSLSRSPVDNSIHTIRWSDASTGKTMILSGRVSEKELLAIRQRIERERETK